MVAPERRSRLLGLYFLVLDFLHRGSQSLAITARFDESRSARALAVVSELRVLFMTERGYYRPVDDNLSSLHVEYYTVLGHERGTNNAVVSIKVHLIEIDYVIYWT